MKYFFEKFCSLYEGSRIGNSHGQGALEYILLIFVVVSLMVGGIYQFSTSFENFTRNYFGEYLQCLLETGELPSLGNENDTGVCSASFGAFTFSDGRPPGSSGAGGSNSGNSGSGSGADQGSEGSGRPDLVSSGQGGSAADGGGAINRTANGSPMFVATNSRSNPNVDLRKSKTGSNDSGGAKGSRNFQNLETDAYDSEDGESLRTRYIYGNKSSPGENENIGGVSLSGEVVVDNSVNGRRPALVPILPDRKKASLEDEETSMGFGDFMRYLIIAAIVISLLLFFGGQIQSITKSMD